MTQFNTENNSNVVSKSVAIEKIVEIAEEQGIRGAFKVIYDGTMMVDSDNLPEQVNMELVKVSAVLDNATLTLNDLGFFVCCG